MIREKIAYDHYNMVLRFYILRTELNALDKESDLAIKARIELDVSYACLFPSPLVSTLNQLHL